MAGRCVGVAASGGRFAVQVTVTCEVAATRCAQPILHVPVTARPACIGDFGRPHDLEPFEHGFDLVVHMEAFGGGSSTEKAPMGGQPPVAGAITLALVQGE